MKFGMIALAAVLSTAPALVACSSSDDKPSNSAEAKDPTNGKIISELVISGDDRTTLSSGKTTKLTATLRYSDGTSRDVSSGAGAVWNSTDTSNATVGQDGLVTAVDEGSTEISVTYNGLVKRDTILVT